jgi:hypothetical protein
MSTEYICEKIKLQVLENAEWTLAFRKVRDTCWWDEWLVEFEQGLSSTWQEQGWIESESGTVMNFVALYCHLQSRNFLCLSQVYDRLPPLRSSGQSSWLQNGDVWCFLWSTN